MTKNKQPSILLVDDDKFLLDMYALKFSKDGFKVLSATCSEDALKILNEGPEPDIVVLDIIMPGMNGLDLLAEIRKENLLKKALVVMLTNQGFSEEIEKAKKLDVNGYIIKATTIPSEVLSEVKAIYEHSLKQ